MNRMIFVAVLTMVTTMACQQKADTFDPNQIIAMERAALDRWSNGDPQGYVEIMAPEVTYFDPNQDKRLDGLQAMRDLLVPLTGKIKVDRYDMLNPTVQRHGDAAVLTFNLVSYRKQADGTERPIVRWNSTEAYARVNGRWQIIHSHWSYVRPDLKLPISEES
jgi:ketosteroid isomerase-like protein